MLNSIDVNIWGHCIGQVLWNCSKGISSFHFNEGLKSPYNRVVPLLREINHSKELIIDGLDCPLYHGLPSFIADSLPDTSQTHYCPDKASTNFRAFVELSQIGESGMGAFVYKSEIPAIKKKPLRVPRFKQEGDFYAFTLDSDIEEAIRQLRDPIGGRKHKFFVSYNTANQEIIIGVPESFEASENFIVKYNESGRYDSILEYIYYLVAIHSGIKMTRSFLVTINRKQHFVTERFDIQNVERVHTQTLAAIMPNSNDYEDLFSVAKRIGVPSEDYSELFKRMVFNIMAHNTDDHTKKFTFSMDQKGNWSLASAYDLIFSFSYGTCKPQIQHTLSVNGKQSGIRLSNISDIAVEYGIKQPEKIISKVVKSLMCLPDYLRRHDVDNMHANIIWRQIQNNMDCLQQ